MKLLVATDLTGEQVQNFFKDFFQLDSAVMSAVTVVPERKKCIEKQRGFSFCIIVSAVNDSIAKFLIGYTFNNNGHMARSGWNDIFPPMEESDVMHMQFIEPSQIEILQHHEEEKPHFGWGGMSELVTSD